MKPEGVSDQVWDEWQSLKKKLCKSCTQRMVDALVREAEKAGITPERAMVIQLEKGWRGFEADWLKEKNQTRSFGFQEKPQEERTYGGWDD